MSFRVPMLIVMMSAMAALAAPPQPYPHTFEREAIDHLIRKLMASVEEQPNDAFAHYVAGQIHYRAYQDGRSAVLVEPRDRRILSLLPKGPTLLTVPLAVGATPKSQSHDTPLSTVERSKHFVQAAWHFATAAQIDKKKGMYHLRLADALIEFASKAHSLSPLTREVVRQDLSEERRQEIKNQITGLCTDYVGVRQRLWLLDNCDDAEPFIAEQLGKAHNHGKQRLRDLLVEYWQDLASEHYAAAHNLTSKQDVAAYNVSYGEPWDKFTSLRAGRLYLQLTARRTDEQTREQSQRIYDTFDALQKKQSDYKGPVR